MTDCAGVYNVIAVLDLRTYVANAMRKSLYLRAAIVLISVLLCFEVAAHPEDEFCNGEGLDPLLCAQLAKLDSSDAIVPGDVQGQTTLVDRSTWTTFTLYVGLGFEHILPAGADHLLFVLALLLASRSLRMVLLQISCFTVAHSITLMAASAGFIHLSSVWIEFFIALSIVVVGLENIIVTARCSYGPHRPHRFFLIFVFGLLHGLGFAGALGEVGLPSEHFLLALLGFNVGVEFGQIVFAGAVFAALFLLMKKSTYHRWVVIPGSLAVASIALYWTYERLLLL